MKKTEEDSFSADKAEETAYKNALSTCLLVFPIMLLLTKVCDVYFIQHFVR